MMRSPLQSSMQLNRMNMTESRSVKFLHSIRNTRVRNPIPVKIQATITTLHWTLNLLLLYSKKAITNQGLFLIIHTKRAKNTNIKETMSTSLMIESRNKVIIVIDTTEIRRRNLTGRKRGGGEMTQAALAAMRETASQIPHTGLKSRQIVLINYIK